MQLVDESGVERQNPAKEVVSEVQVFEVTHLGNEGWNGPIELVGTEIQVNQTGYGRQGVRKRAREGVGIQGEVFQRNEVSNGRGYITLELIRRKDQNLEVVQHGDGGGYVSSEVVGRKIDVGEVGRVEVFRERAGEVGVGNGEGLEVGEVGEEDVGSGGFDGEVGEGEVGEVGEAWEGDGGDVAEAVEGGEGAERGGELGREARGGGGGGEGAVEEEEGVEGGEGFEGCEGEGEMGRGAVGEL